MGWLFLTPHEADVVREATAMLVPGPADAPGETAPGAREADVVRYVDRLLGAFETDPPLVYASGRPDGSFLPLSPAQQMGWRRRVDGLQQAYRTGVLALDRLADGDFTCAPQEVRHRALCDAEATAFRDLLFDHAIEGTYGDPVYRGRPTVVGRTVLGLPGPREGRPDPVRPYAGEGPDPLATLAQHFLEAARAVASSGCSDD
ncbi:gluconate 2-dehydrogenase subunit 3 family protein [Streptomyces sp. 4503]|uniref:Gluconate 2-dehydrogenase subunit 3 family protein n=1 Tax=Streptomyces niphimycinicus TaxID=2842201 RepID=A0ABS6CB15_9ACTN|nr:gluconate 2-dehydrogenase subunit 3 family protein [Streptomyces niphimycinicus]MBU3864073.1 gluconate 2-dehydrogenase subunit 3 family protein [Streptomyces niphimycinicus]